MAVTERKEFAMSEDELGPIDYLAVEFSDGRITGEDASLLLDAVDRGVLRVLDLEFVAKGPDGALRRVDLDELQNPEGVDLNVWRGAFSGLLDESDLGEIGSRLQAGSIAAIVIYENLWTITLDSVLHQHGARLVGDGRIAPEEVLAALEETDET
jgi:Family of unknown function (DUF6325)